MQAVLDWLKGRKSYVLLIVAFAFNLGQLLGFWTADNQIWASIDTLLLALLGASFRAAIAASGAVTAVEKDRDGTVTKAVLIPPSAIEKADAPK